MMIKLWPSKERPRERLLSHGAHTLTDSELLAILIAKGQHGKDAVELARELLTKLNGFRGIVNSDLKKLCSFSGVGVTKYCQIQAAAELGKRFLREGLPHREGIQHSRDAQDFIIASLRDCQQEIFAGLFLDNQHRVIQFEYLFYGTISSANVYPREVVKRSLALNAAAIIVAHNHPSGIAEPSKADRDMTHCLKQALELVEVKLLDHLIVGDNMAISLAERGFM